MDEQHAEILVAAFCDTRQTRLGNGRDLAWNEAKPGRKVMSKGERLAVTDSSD
ncbi:MAG TPA: hypothetical protein VMA37_00110 [Acetobacteraceae bacterium]|nr:hypothetical protein [Acetobacteraceae bacterium]